MDNFFQQNAITKCDQCKIKKENNTINRGWKYSKNNYLYKHSRKTEILIIVESNLEITELVNWFKDNKFKNFTIISALDCYYNSSNIENKDKSIYGKCKNIDLSQYSDIKCILTMGDALFSLVNSKDISYYGYLREHQFNPTFIYTKFTEKNIRIYPFPYTMACPSYNHPESYHQFFFWLQTTKVKEYLDNFDEINNVYSEHINPTYNTIMIEDPNLFLLVNTNKKCKVAIDTETSGLDQFSKDFKVGCITLSFTGVDGYYLPWDRIGIDNLSNFLKNKYQIYANGKFDSKVLKLAGVKNVRVDEDIILLAHLLNTDRTNNRLKTLAWFVGFGGYDSELDSYIKQYKVKNYLEIPESKLYKYACLDAIVTLRLHLYFIDLFTNTKKTIEFDPQPKIYDCYKNIVIPALVPFEQMELDGMTINLDYLSKLHNKLKDKSKILEKEIKEITGDINLNSVDQLAKALEQIGLPDIGRSFKKYWVDSKGVQHYNYKTGEPQLLAWKKKGKWLIIDKLLEYRKVITLLKTFVGEVSKDDSFFVQQEVNKKYEGLVKFIRDDKKVHSVYGVAMTKTGRSRVSMPNIQNQPHQDDIAKEFRPVYFCPKDYYMCEADYSGFQLRIVAHYSKDPVMLKIFNSANPDLHSITARNVFCRDMTIDEFLSKKKEEPYKHYRFVAKSINFRYCFGGTAWGFKPTLEETWTDEQIKKYIKTNKNINGKPIEMEIYKYREDPYLTVANDMREKFFDTFKGVAKWIKNIQEKAVKQGCVTSYHGGVRHLPELLFKSLMSPKEKHDREKKLNMATNAPVQHCEAMEVYKAMSKIFNNIVNLKSKMACMIHDSVVLYVHKSEVLLMWYLLKLSMENHTEFDIPILIDVAYGKVWGFGKELETEDELLSWIKDEGILNIQKEKIN